MSTPSPVLLPHFDLIGDLAAETWPQYLDHRTFSIFAELVISQCDFRVRRPVLTAVGDPVHRFLVGESIWSRKLATDARDPLGIVYLLEDDGSDWFGEWDLKPVVAVRAVTLGHLVKLGHSGIKNFLEADKHLNLRLSPSEVTGGGILTPPLI